MEPRQHPLPNGQPKPAPLISSLRRAFAAKAGCEISEVVTKMWEILSSTVLDDVDEYLLVRVVQGLELREGG